MKRFTVCLVMLLTSIAARSLHAEPLRISGIYPHLTAYNGHGECGIGAVVPWAGRLWWITYPPHYRTGSNDKLYSIDESFALKIHPESVGGTHAARMIHRESKQLFIGPYAINEAGKVRAMNVKAIPGRYTAWARHLTDPANKLYMYDMEGPVWEVDVQSLAGKELFRKPLAGWHGKGAYTGQGRLIVSNNGGHNAHLKGTWEHPKAKWSKGAEDAGVLGEWNGKAWSTLLRRQFVDIAGPGGIHGNANDSDPVWAMGWDRRSVILMLLDEGKWHRFRLPKASHAMDPSHGWYTEWPRIRPISETRALMCMHGMFYDFPLSFSAKAAQRIRPIATHLRYVPDFAMWNDKLVLAADDASIMQNPTTGQSQSNLWFGKVDELKQWGPGFAFGGPWLGDAVKANTPSDAYLFAGFESRLLHLAARDGANLEVTVEVSNDGLSDWKTLTTIAVPKAGYSFHRFADDVEGEWVRFRIPRDETISAYFHYGRAKGRKHPHDAKLFAGLNANASPGHVMRVRAAGHNRNLQIVLEKQGKPGAFDYFEADEKLNIAALDQANQVASAKHIAHAAKVLKLEPNVRYDDASAIVTSHDKQQYRLPVVEGTKPIGRDLREVQSERSIAHIGNIFYEVPRGDANKHDLNIRRMRPVSAHRFSIHDMCSWRGMLVLAGAKPQAAGDGHVFALPDDRGAIWCGMVDDLWKLGKPVGVGGPWKNTAVKANQPSLPYLMTGFDKKTVTLSHNAKERVSIRLEIDYSNRPYWKPFKTFAIPPGETVTFTFTEGYSAHWVRAVTDKACQATVQFRYE